MIFDKTNIQILKHLLFDSRQSARQLSLKLGLSTVTVLSRIKKLEKEEIIKGYYVNLDHEKLGYQLTAIIELMSKKGQLVKLEERLTTFENVCGVYDVTGNSDAIIIAKFKDRSELSKFVKGLSSIPNVQNTVTHVVLNTAKEDFRLI